MENDRFGEGNSVRAIAMILFLDSAKMFFRREFFSYEPEA
jgi:hypothetical protein